MIALALLSPTIIVLAAIWFYDRERDRAARAQIVATERSLAVVRVQAETFATQANLMDDMVRRHALHVDRLVQRIQAPDVAVAQQASYDLVIPDRQFVGFDNDHEFQADLNQVQEEGPAMDWRAYLADRANGD